VADAAMSTDRAAGTCCLLRPGIARGGSVIEGGASADNARNALASRFRAWLQSNRACRRRWVRPTPKRLRVCSEILIHLQLRDRPANQEKRPAGATPPTFSCNCRLAGPVPLRFSALRAPSKTKIRVALHLCNCPSGYVRHSRSALAAERANALAASTCEAFSARRW
jgi:hypothetical protein